MVEFQFAIPLEKECKAKLDMEDHIKKLREKHHPCNAEVPSKMCTYCFHKRDRTVTLMQSCKMQQPPENCYKNKTAISNLKCTDCVQINSYEEDGL